MIKDYATFVVCQTDNGYKILEPIQNRKQQKLTCKDWIVYENIEYSHIKERRDNT